MRYFSPTLFYLRVHVIQAQLQDERNRARALQVRARVGNFRRNTRRLIVGRNEDPKWNEDLLFVVGEPFDDPLVLTVGRATCQIRLNDVAERFTDRSIPANFYDLREIGAGARQYMGRLELRICLEKGYHVFDEPMEYVSDYRASMDIQVPRIAPIGSLELDVKEATLSYDGNGTYCLAKYGPKWERTRTVATCNPQWNEKFIWDVYDPCTVITIGVFCDNGGDADVILGRIRFRLSSLLCYKSAVTGLYRLFLLRPPHGVQQLGIIHLGLRFRCGCDLFKVYFQPLLPAMHRLQPLSYEQRLSLRDQALVIVSLGLQRHQPQLGRTVVAYMLDDRFEQWSERKARVNFSRLQVAFGPFTNIWGRYDGIRKWRNPTATMAVILIYLFLVVTSNLILPAIIFYWVLVCVWQYWRQPQKLPHTDHVTLSLAGIGNSFHMEAVLNEEFDSWPTSKEGDDMLRSRYDCLRVMGAKGTMLMGCLADVGERFLSLLSWQDVIASQIFMIFCLTVVGLMLAIYHCFGISPWSFCHFMGFILAITPAHRFLYNFYTRLPTRMDRLL